MVGMTDTTTRAEGTPRRRAPAPGDRHRDAGRSRRRILEAALSEFAANGYAGATVREIARRAGVNTQLISYYFGGKEGLYNELVASWRQWEAQVDEDGLSFADVVVTYLEQLAKRPETLRMFVWEGLTRRAPRPGGTVESPREQAEIAAVRRRQANGEIADDLDPGFLLLTFMGAIATMVTMPDMIERLCGVRADSEEFVARFSDHLRSLLGHLKGR